MNDLKIIGWTDFDCNYPTKKYSKEELIEVLELIKQEIMDNNYIFTGQEHQNSLTGVPVFSDGTCFRASMRCWGVIMSSVYAGPNGEKLSYMDFYMFLDGESNMPKNVDIDITPAILEEQSFGCTIKQDRDIVYESISMGMPFITTDKVLQKLVEESKNNNE